MIVLEALQSFLVSILIAYLSFTGSLAERIEGAITNTSHVTQTSEQTVIPTPQEVATPSEKLSILSRLYATTNGVSKVLFESKAFQEAARELRGTAAVITPELDPKALDESMTASLVNILCEYKTDAYTRTTTGTGFFIHETGVILTNAHVAQFLLLESIDKTIGNADCVIRTGNPATPRYRAELLFISPTWIFNNADLISSEHPRGTGEHDYALLYVSGSLTNNPLSTSFPALKIHTDFLPKNLTGSEVVSAGYPAEKLSREGPRAVLVPELARTHIGELYTFGSNYADIFSIAESPVGEQGASGGPVVSPLLGAIGLIVTKGDAVTEGEKSLRALTLSYIDRTITEETGYSLLENAGGNLAYRGKVFKEALAPFLTQLLMYELKE